MIKPMIPHTTRVAFAFVFACAGVGAATEPAKIFGTNVRTNQRLQEAADLEKAARWAEAVDLYVRIADESGDDLVADTANNGHLVPARMFAQQRIGARQEMVGLYRVRFEPRAQQLLASANPLDPKPLAQLVASALCTRAAEAALHRLGDLACEAGDFAMARRWWSMLLPPERPGHLVHSDPAGDIAIVRAKLILARLLAGETAIARTEIEAFRRDHAAATGHLAGHSGNLLATLQTLSGDATTPVAVARPDFAKPTTFSYSPSRNGVVTGRLPAYAPEARYPPIVLSDAAPRQDDRLTQPTPVKPAALAYHPIVVNRRVYVADATSISGFDLDTGARVARLTLDRASHRLPSSDAKPLNATEVRYTLTMAGDRLFARLGQSRVHPDRTDADSYLVCARIATDGQLKLCWSLAAQKPNDASVAVWEGTPLLSDGRLFVAVTRLDGNRAVTAVGCFDPADPPTLLWKQDVFEAAAETADRTQHLLLAIAGPLVVCGPHAGTVVALDTSTGRRAWAARYEATDPKMEPADAPFRELGPCIAAGGVLYAAPADADRVFAFDAATGARVWQSDPLPLSYLLGVARDVVVGQRAGPLAGLAALDARTGHVLPNWGYVVFGGDAVAPFGRGFVAGNRVYWPTRANGVREIHLDGTVEYPPTSFRNLPGGNLVYGDGGLVVATADRLHVLLPPHKDSGVQAAHRGSTEGTVALRAVPIEALTGDSRPLPAVVAVAADDPINRIAEMVMPLTPGVDLVAFDEGVDQSVFVVSKNGVARRDWPSGRQIWSRHVGFAPSWVGVSNGTVIVGSSSDIAGIDVGEGRVIWHKRVGISEATGERGWSDQYSIADDRLALHDYAVRDGTVEVRLGHRPPESIRARTGVIIGRSSIDDDDEYRTVNGDGIVVTAANRRLVASDPKTGKTVWDRKLPNESNLSGEPPRLRLVGGDLLVGLPRNDGFEIERLDAKSGKPRSGIPFVRAVRAFELSAAAVVDGMLVVAAGGKLIAWEGGRVVWQNPLPVGGPWRIEPAGDGMFVTWPVPSPASPPLAKWPIVAGFVTDGRVAARWEFGRPGPHGAVCVAAGTLTVATEREVRRVKLPVWRGDR